MEQVCTIVRLLEKIKEIKKRIEIISRWLLVRSVGAEYQSTVVTTTLAQSMVNCTQVMDGIKQLILANGDMSLPGC